MSKRTTRHSRRRQKANPVRALKQVTVSLDTYETKLAAQLGDGDVGLGIRRALILVGRRLIPG